MFNIILIFFSTFVKNPNEMVALIKSEYNNKRVYWREFVHMYMMAHIRYVLYSCGQSAAYTHADKNTKHQWRTFNNACPSNSDSLKCLNQMIGYEAFELCILTVNMRCLFVQCIRRHRRWKLAKFGIQLINRWKRRVWNVNRTVATAYDQPISLIIWPEISAHISIDRVLVDKHFWKHGLSFHSMAFISSFFRCCLNLIKLVHSE